MAFVAILFSGFALTLYQYKHQILKLFESSVARDVRRQAEPVSYLSFFTSTKPEETPSPWSEFACFLGPIVAISLLALVLGRLTVATRSKTPVITESKSVEALRNKESKDAVQDYTLQEK